MSQLNSAVWAPPRWRAPVGLGEKRVRTCGVPGELDELGELGKIGKTPYEMLLVYHNFPAWARGLTGQPYNP